MGALDDHCVDLAGGEAGQQVLHGRHGLGIVVVAGLISDDLDAGHVLGNVSLQAGSSVGGVGGTQQRLDQDDLGRIGLAVLLQQLMEHLALAPAVVVVVAAHEGQDIGAVTHIALGIDNGNTGIHHLVNCRSQSVGLVGKHDHQILFLLDEGLQDVHLDVRILLAILEVQLDVRMLLSERTHHVIAIGLPGRRERTGADANLKDPVFAASILLNGRILVLRSGLLFRFAAAGGQRQQKAPNQTKGEYVTSFHVYPPLWPAAAGILFSIPC